MRKLYITRGIPGAGKSALLAQAGLAPYVLSPDDIRLMMAAPVLDMNGKLSISQKNDRKVWDMLYKLLEQRMTNGDVVVVDATHTTQRSYGMYMQLAHQYRYDCFLIDCADVPLEVAKERNREREPYKVVPDGVLDDMYHRLSGLKVPKRWQVLKTAEEIARSLEHPCYDFLHYRRVHHIGDIQGTLAPLEEYFRQHPMVDDEAYIFVGDLLDRGPDNAGVLHFVCDQLVGRDNVYFVEGNHDLYLWQWLNNLPVTAREFNGRTKRQLEATTFDKQRLYKLFTDMTPALHYTHGEREVLVTHGGLASLPENLGLVSARQCIRGVGEYKEVGAADDAFVRNTGPTMYQVHGHRNADDHPTQYNERCFNLEGKVEFGGELRVVQLSSHGFTEASIASQASDVPVQTGQNHDLIASLRANRLITERTLPGSISSFHFKPEVMFRGKWSRQTMTTRGLFINTLTGEIVIRAYDKFFNIGEKRQTEYENLRENLTFPVQAWVKENGYLGLVGYDASIGDIVVSSKSTTEGEFAEWASELFEKAAAPKRDEIARYLEDHNVTLVFEVIRPRHDPHIIEYVHDDLVLLEIVKRQPEFAALPFSEVEKVARLLGVRSKRLGATLQDWAEFEAWYQTVMSPNYTFDDTPIEGFVLEDAAGWRVKAKLNYYQFWKQLRSQFDAMKKGRTPKVPAYSTDSARAEQVIDYMKGLPKEKLTSMTILEVRAGFEAAEAVENGRIS